jgi:hypothetical protein
MFDDSPATLINRTRDLDASKVGQLVLSDVAEKVLSQNYPGGDQFNPIVQAVVRINRDDNAAIQKEWETVSKPTGFVDFIADGFGNLLAGAINAIVPGSNLGDQSNPSNIVGNIAATVVNPAGAILSGVSKASKGMSFLSSAIDFVGKVASGPIGSIGSSLLNSYVGSMSNAMAAQAAAFNGPTAMNIAETKSAPAQAAAFGNTGQAKFDTGVAIKASGGSTASTASASSMPTWFKPVLILVGIVAALFAGFKLLSKKR